MDNTNQERHENQPIEFKKTYETPGLQVLGSVVDTTGGPSQGTLDQLAGGTGGFMTTPS